MCLPVEHIKAALLDEEEHERIEVEVMHCCVDRYSCAKSPNFKTFYFPLPFRINTSCL